MMTTCMIQPAMNTMKPRLTAVLACSRMTATHSWIPMAVNTQLTCAHISDGIMFAAPMLFECLAIDNVKLHFSCKHTQMQR